MSALSLLFMLPSGYCAVYPEQFNDMFSGWLKGGSVSLLQARILSISLLILSLALLIIPANIIFDFL